VTQISIKKILQNGLKKYFFIRINSLRTKTLMTINKKKLYANFRAIYKDSSIKLSSIYAHCVFPFQ
jgi:hypothetical protein